MSEKTELDISRLNELIVGDIGRVHLLQRILELRQKENDQILDVGCGNCSLWKPFVNRYLLNLWGIDRDEDKIFEAQKVIQGRAIYGSVYELCRYFEKSYFDIVISTQVFSYLKKLKSAFIEINKILKPGGCLLFTIGMTKYNYSPLKQFKRRIAGLLYEKHYFRRYTDIELSELL
jgi:ubiquinone/menaquinone biosynthesis C-methylase UbiE